MMNQVTVAELKVWRMPEAAEELERYLAGAEMSVALLYEEYERCATSSRSAPPPIIRPSQKS